MVHFVGAGSGAADLITVRGARLLEEADVVIYAGSLVNPALLQYTRTDCAVYNSAEMTLEQVLSVVKEAEAAGKTTVRLHTGDSSIYGAVREQFDQLEELGIAYDVCPGVSSFCGAAAALRAEYTLQEDLIAGGYAPDTPAAVVYKATWPEEKIFRCTVETLAKTVAENGLTKTSLLIVGGCLGGGYLRSKLYDPAFTTEFRKGSET